MSVLRSPPRLPPDSPGARALIGDYMGLCEYLRRRFFDFEKQVIPAKAGIQSGGGAILTLFLTTESEGRGFSPALPADTSKPGGKCGLRAGGVDSRLRGNDAICERARLSTDTPTGVVRRCGTACPLNACESAGGDANGSRPRGAGDDGRGGGWSAPAWRFHAKPPPVRPGRLRDRPE